jgi:SAM-dependent methyltransferase
LNAIRTRIDAEIRRADARESLRFDRSVGIEATGKTLPSEMTVVGERATGHLYVGEPVRVTRWWLGELPDRLDGFTFIDMGSGKGRPLFAAAEAGKGFGRIVGVEYGRELHEAALANIARFRGDRSAEIVSICADARSYEFPLEPLVVHWSNPFTEDVMADVIINLVASYGRRPRPIFAIYYQRWHERNATANVELLSDVAIFSRHRTLEPAGVSARARFAAHRVDMFESAEAAALASA